MLSPHHTAAAGAMPASAAASRRTHCGTFDDSRYSQMAIGTIRIGSSCRVSSPSPSHQPIHAGFTGSSDRVALHVQYAARVTNNSESGALKPNLLYGHSRVAKAGV